MSFAESFALKLESVFPFIVCSLLFTQSELNWSEINQKRVFDSYFVAMQKLDGKWLSTVDVGAGRASKKWT